MVIQCPQCGKKYKVDPEKIPEKGAKISCPGCGHNFMVKKKKDKDKESAAAVTAKNPPCQMCGAPSTRVLRGNPPQVLCDACFEREKEKTRRFSHIKPSVEEMIPPMPPAPAGAEAAEEKPAPGTQDRFEVKPEGEHEFEPEPETGEAPEVESKETEYFDSFAEIPDLEDAEAKPGTAEGKTLQEELQQLENIEPPVFDETGFDAPIKTKEIPKPEKASGPLAPPPAPARPTEDRASASDEYVFSPKEINRLEDTTGPQPEPRFRREDLSPPPQAAFPESGAGLRESSLDREIFGELAAQKGIAAEPGPALKKTRFFRMPRVPVKTAVSIGVILLVLIAGYFLFTSESVRNSLSKISARPEPGTEPVAVLSEEDQRILNEHLLLAQELFRLDTKKNDLEALAEIRSALKMDKRSVAAQSWNLLISSQLALRNPGFISLSRARVLLKKADPELIKTAEGRSGRALVYLSEKNYSGARVVAENLVSENPNYGLGYWVLAQIETGGAVIKYEEAEGLLQKAVALDPNLVQARFALAEINFQQKKYEPALAQFQETLKLSPEHSEAAARLKEIQALLARANPPEEKPGGGVLIAKPGPVPGATSQMGTTAGPQPMLIPISPVTGATTGAPSVQVDLDQELQKMLLQIIAETRPPLSRGKNSAPITSPSPTPVQPTPAPLPPEETPGQPGTTRPPEEAP